MLCFPDSALENSKNQKFIHFQVLQVHGIKICEVILDNPLTYRGIYCDVSPFCFWFGFLGFLANSKFFNTLLYGVPVRSFLTFLSHLLSCTLCCPLQTCSILATNISAFASASLPKLGTSVSLAYWALSVRTLSSVPAKYLV